MSSVETSSQPPQWMLLLENKQRKQHRLAHEIGAGAPCLTCGSSCPGLDLHFWRKLCRNCKCRKEDHDVTEDDSYLQFEILLSSNDSKTRIRPKKAVLDVKLKNEDVQLVGGSKELKGGEKKGITFDWVPPNVSSDLAAEYMQQLPANKLPISGSAGAQYRRQQLERQIPLHDLAPNMCHDLSACEIQRLKEYLENVKNHVVGQAQIEKVGFVPMQYTEHSVPHASKLELKHSQYLKSQPQRIVNLNTAPKPFVPSTNFKIDSSDDLPLPPVSLTEQPLPDLKVPSAFIPHDTFRKTPYKGVYLQSSTVNPGNSSMVTQHVNSSPSFIQHLSNFSDNKLPTMNEHIGIYQRDPVGQKVLHSAHLPKQEPGYSSDINTENNNEPNQNVYYNEPDNGDTNQVSNISNNNILPVELEPYVAALDISKVPVNEAQSSIVNRLPESKTAPLYSSGQPLEQQYKPQLQDGVFNTSNKIPAFVQHSDTAYNQQPEFSQPLKPYDLQHKFIYQPGFESAPLGYAPVPDQFSQVVEGTNTVRLGGNKEPFKPDVPAPTPPTKTLDCHHCLKPIGQGEIAVLAERTGRGIAWHPQCFVCFTCQELLVDLVYFFHKGKVFCGRHYAEIMKIPRCFACDELIFVNEYTCAEGQAFHVRHFCCLECDTELGGKQYIPKDDHPVCLDCYHTKYGKKCHTCKTVIAATEQGVCWKHLNWHARDECFCCYHCTRSLLGSKFVIKNEQPFCNKDCVIKNAGI